jgi:CRP-like cAMP-binding protein
MPPSSDHPLPANWLLAGLSPRVWSRLRPLLELEPLGAGQALDRTGEPFDYAYFPETGMVSIVSTLGDGAGVEVGIVGREGVVGLPVVLGARRAPPLDVFVQIAGDGWRMKASALRAEMERSSAFRQRLFLYAPG